jgi:hypothetical protein
MENPYYKMMINNARAFVRSSKNQEDVDRISIFEISEVLAICTGKLKEDIVIEISGLKL